MAKRCKFCRRWMSDEHEDFCSAKCEDRYFNKKEERTCSKCGRQYMTYVDTWGTVCSRCAYQANYKAPEKKQQETKKHKKYGSIEDILAEQRRIWEETGRWLSYGQIMANKRGATWTENGSSK